MRDRTLPLLFLILFLGLWAALPGTHLVMDEGYRMLQSGSLRNGLRFPVVVPYPGMDSLGSLAEEVRPLPAHYGKFTGEGLVCFYNPALPLLAAPFEGRMKLLVPAFSGFLLWLYLRRRLLARGFSPSTAAFIPLLGTPLLFFSMRFWSYPLSILLALLSVESAESGKPWRAFLLAAAAALFRMEFAVAFIPVFLKLRMPVLRRALSAVPAVLLLLGGNAILSGGDPLGNHFSSGLSEQDLYENENSGMATQKLGAWSRALFPMVPGETSVPWMAPGLLLWLLWAWNLRSKQRSRVPFILAGVMIAASALLWALRGFPFLDGFSMKNPLMVIPALWLVDSGTLRRSRAELPVLALLLLFLLPMHTEGPDWGVRHLFLPAFLFLRNLEPGCKKAFPVLAAGALALCAALVFLGVNRKRVEDLNALAARSGGALVTTNWMIPGWLTGSMLEGKPVIYTSTASLFLESMQLLEAGDPAVVCLERDAAFTAGLLAENGFGHTLSGAADMGRGLSIVVFSRKTLSE